MIKEQEFRQIGQFYKLYSCKDKYRSKNQCSYNSSEEYFMLELLWDFEKDLKKGDNIILTAFGAGFVNGASYLKWAYDGASAAMVK